MNRIEAEGKLKHYHDTYGDLVYTAEPVALREHARDFQAQAAEAGVENTEAALLLLVKAVQYETIALCRESLGDEWVSPVTKAAVPEVEEKGNVSSLDRFRQKREKDDGGDLTNVSRSDILAQANALINTLDDEMEPEFFSMKQLTHDTVKPKFKIGDPCWVPDWHEDTGEVIGYLPATVTGLEIYPDEVFYMIGFHDEVDGLVTTNFESVEEDDIFTEMPDQKPKPKGRPVLSIVK